MKISIQAAAAAVTLFATPALHAQEAVQWKVSDGGNGHWYRYTTNATTWSAGAANARAIGGHLATLSSAQEALFLRTLGAGTVWFGMYQNRSSAAFAEPAGGWEWVNGEDVVYTNWRVNTNGQPDEPNNIGGEDFGLMDANAITWNDGQETGPYPSFIEWDADCNNDGIVDYGQCHDGTLADYDGDNVPDCCERGETCVVGNYPVQWRVSDGGNGHWYQGRRLSDSSFVSWSYAQAAAVAAGGDLVTLNTPQEAAWVYEAVAQDASLWSLTVGPWIGAVQAPGSAEPASGWQWVDGTSLYDGFPWTPAHQPDNAVYCGGNENRVCYWFGEGVPKPANRFADLVESGYCIVRAAGDWVTSAIIEWSADCNSDGIVDYGQILQGQLADTNADGVPDICQGPTCADADIYRDFNVNGADLGILLSQWGPNTPLTESDLNGDGVVNGADLGLLLSFWGACP